MSTQRKKNEHRYMLGNLVKDENGNVLKICRISDKGITTSIGKEVSYEEIRPIPLSDEFLKDNEFIFNESEKSKGTLGGVLTTISAPDYYGPCITKREYNFYEREAEYAIAGIVVRTVDELQNLYNVCGCSSISEKFFIK